MPKISTKLINDKFLEKVASGDMEKAAEVATDYTRITLMEEGLLRKIMPPETITYADLDKQLDTNEPTVIVDKEVTQPMSVSVGFGTLPKNRIMRGDRYRVDLARIISPNFVEDVARLEGYSYDIRNMFKEKAILNHMTAEDVTWFNQIDNIVKPTAENGVDWAANKALMVSGVTGKVQYYDFTDSKKNPLKTASGFSRDSLVEALKILRTGFTPSTAPLGQNEMPIRLNTDLVVMNVNTAAEYIKFVHTDIGDMSTELFKDGLDKEVNILGHRHLLTMKDDIVKDGEAYYFAAPEYLGKFYELQQPTMFVDRRAFMIEFFIYSCLGATIGNAFGVAKAKFF